MESKTKTFTHSQHYIDTMITSNDNEKNCRKKNSVDCSSVLAFSNFADQTIIEIRYTLTEKIIRTKQTNRMKKNTTTYNEQSEEREYM